MFSRIDQRHGGGHARAAVGATDADRASRSCCDVVPSSLKLMPAGQSAVTP
jgi:hypothetical protein